MHPETTPNPAPTAPMSTPPVMDQSATHKKIGPIIAGLAVLLLIIIAALYIFASRMSDAPMPTDTGMNAQQSSSVQPVTGTSDDVSSLEADLDASVQGLDGQNF